MAPRSVCFVNIRAKETTNLKDFLNTRQHGGTVLWVVQPFWIMTKKYSWYNKH